MSKQLNLLKVCQEHGADYLGHKCRFCCSLASIVCGGGGHYCKDCYGQAARLQAMPSDQMPKCPIGGFGNKLFEMPFYLI